MSGRPRLVTSIRLLQRDYKNMRSSSGYSSSSSSCSTEIEERIHQLFEKIEVDPTIHTKSGWCLKDGLSHIASVGRMKNAEDKKRGSKSTSVCSTDSSAKTFAADTELLSLVELHGIPGFYVKENNRKKKNMCRHHATQDIKDPKTCFQSLVRIIAGQFVSGQAAQAAWVRLLGVVEDDLTPGAILKLISVNVNDDCSSLSCCINEEMIENLKKSARITRAKSIAIIDLAQRFSNGQLSEEMLLSSKNNGKEDCDESSQKIRTELLKVKGIGPWSCDMFMMFYLEKSNILPLGDLGVRKGLALFFGWKGSAPKQQLCPKKDLKWIEKELKAYEPYRSLLTYFMWRVADTPIQDGGDHGGGDINVEKKGVDGRKEVEELDKQHEASKSRQLEQPIVSAANVYGNSSVSSPSKKRMTRMDDSSAASLVGSCINEMGEENCTPSKKRRSKRTIKRVVTP